MICLQMIIWTTHKTSDINFSILKDVNSKNIEQKNLNGILTLKNVESFSYKHQVIKSDEANENINDLKISKKFLDESDDLLDTIVKK